MDEYQIIFHCQYLNNEEEFYARRNFCARNLIDACEMAELNMSQTSEIHGEDFKAEIIEAKLLVDGQKN